KPVNEALEELRRLTRWADERAAHLLHACATRGQLVILAEYQHDLPAARSVASDSLVTIPADAPERFLVEVTMGTQCGFAHEYADAMRLLRGALSGDSSGFRMNRMFALLAAVEAAWEVESDAALGFAQQAVTQMGQLPHVAPELTARVYAELAVCLWTG